MFLCPGKVYIMLSDHKDVSLYISQAYSRARKIVEVGIGGEDSIYNELKRNLQAEVMATDKFSGENISYDDAFEPDLKIYHGADLIYSIRPSPELIPVLREIAKKVGANLLIRPLSTDSHYKPDSMVLVNFGKAVLWEEKQ
jgi:uncharacterized UPF0146 family protein